MDRPPSPGERGADPGHLSSARRGGGRARRARARITTPAAWVGGLALVAVHVGGVEPGPDAPPLAGWVPAELAWRLLWILLAWLYLLWFCAFAWRAGDEA